VDELNDDEEERERQFFGDDQYTILSHGPDQDEHTIAMSMTMQQRENKEKRDRVESLRKEIEQLQVKIRMQKELGEHIAGKSVIF